MGLRQGLPKGAGPVWATQGPGRGLLLSHGTALAGSLEEASLLLTCEGLLHRESPPCSQAASHLMVCTPVPGRGAVSSCGVTKCMFVRRTRVALCWPPGRPATLRGKGRRTAAGRSPHPTTFTQFDED